MRKKINEISVLIVDDNHVNRRVLNYLMMRYKTQVDEAENGLIAFEKYKNKKYDLILMDIMMPVMDGLESTTKIREFEKTTNTEKAIILAISANFQDEDLDDYLSRGIDEVFKKPVDFSRLNEFLEKHFEI